MKEEEEEEEEEEKEEEEEEEEKGERRRRMVKRRKMRRTRWLKEQRSNRGLKMKGRLGTAMEFGTIINNKTFN